MRMNFQCDPIIEPIKVIFVNPLGPAAQLVITKLLSGAVFEDYQMVDLCLLVYANEITAAEQFKLEIESCAFSSTNSIKVTSDLPSISDCDVFCFMTNFPNPNVIEDSLKEFEDNYEDLYLIIKIAKNFVAGDRVEKLNTNITKNVANKTGKRIIMADGLIAIDILKSLSTNLPADIFFCPSPLTSIAKSIIGEYLNVECNAINDAFVWAANDNVFHIEMEKPLIINDVGTDRSQCNTGLVRKELLESQNLDHTQISASWLKKEFLSKVACSASKNPYGCIYRAFEFAKTLRDIWSTRSGKEETKVYRNVGVISDGSNGTLKGYPYVLPLVLSGNAYKVCNRYENDIHLKQEIKNINKECKKCHELLMHYCKRVLVEKMINNDSTTEDSVSSSVYC